MSALENMIIKFVSEYADDDSQNFKEEKQILNQEIQLQKDKKENLKKEKKRKNKNLIFLDIITFGVFRYFRNKKFKQKNKKIKNQIKDLKTKITNLNATEEHCTKTTLSNTLRLFDCYKQQQEAENRESNFLHTITFGFFKRSPKSKAEETKTTNTVNVGNKFYFNLETGKFSSSSDSNQNEDFVVITEENDGDKAYFNSETDKFSSSSDSNQNEDFVVITEENDGDKVYFNSETKTFYSISKSHQDEDFVVLQELETNCVSSNKQSFLNHKNIINNFENGCLENSVNSGRLSLQLQR